VLWCLYSFSSIKYLLVSSVLQNAIECQKLTSSLNRGGLWAISKNAQSIFERTEHYFRDATSKTNVQNIAYASIISRSVHDVEVDSTYNSMLSNSELIINSSVTKNVLHNIIQLYVKGLKREVWYLIVKQNKTSSLRNSGSWN